MDSLLALVPWFVLVGLAIGTAYTVQNRVVSPLFRRMVQDATRRVRIRLKTVERAIGLEWDDDNADGRGGYVEVEGYEPVDTRIGTIETFIALAAYVEDDEGEGGE